MHRSLPIAILLLIASTLAISAQDTDDAKYEDVLQMLLGSIGQITKSLEKVTDSDSAQSVRVELRKQTEEFRDIRKKSEALAPPSTEAKERISKKYQPEFEKARKALAAQIARVQRVPGGTPALLEIRGVFERSGQ